MYVNSDNVQNYLQSLLPLAVSVIIAINNRITKYVYINHQCRKP